MTSAFSWENSTSLCPASFCTPRPIVYDNVHFIIGDWNAKVGSEEIPGITGKFGLGAQNEAGPRLVEFCQEKTLVIANTLFQQQGTTLHMDITRWSYRIQLDYILGS